MANTILKFRTPSGNDVVRVFGSAHAALIYALDSGSTYFKIDSLTQKERARNLQKRFPFLLDWQADAMAEKLYLIPELYPRLRYDEED